MIRIRQGTGYDALKRLNWSTASTPATWTQNYQYDGFGNITWKSSPQGSGEPGYPVVNSAKNQLSIATYDANGNTTSLNNTGFSYDGMNRMSTLTSGSSAVTYAYDENNRRIERNASSAGGNDEIYFYAPDGRLLSAFAYGFTAPLFQRVYFGSMLIGATSSAAYSDTYVLMDRLGTAAAGYAYGTDIESPGTGWDEPDFATYTVEFAGLEYANQRYYSAGYGSFMTVDRSGRNVDPTNPISWNHFAYANGDPVGKNDPSGSCAEGDASCNACPEGDPGCSCPDQTCLCDPTDPTSPCYQQACSAAANGFEPDPEAIAGPGCSGPPPPPAVTPPSCSITLYDRPTPFGFSPGNHSWLYAQGPSGAGEAFEGAPTLHPSLGFGFLHGNWGNLIGDINSPGSFLRGDDTSTNTLVGEESGPGVCAQIQTLTNEVDAYDITGAYLAVEYRPIPGRGFYNSNSFTYTLLQSIGLSFGTPVDWVPGWGKLVPGLNTFLNYLPAL